MKPTLSLPIAAVCLIPGFLAAAPSGLVHHWNFDEGPDWHDSAFQSVYNGTQAFDSEGVSHATLQNMAAANWVSGHQFTGMEFNGSNQYLSVPASLATDLGGSASLSFWLRTSQTGAATPATAPGVTGSGGIQWGWLDANGRIGLGLDGASVVQSAAAVNDGRWHHIVLTRNASTGAAQVFVDGVLSASATGPTGIRSASFTSLGRIEGAGYFQGRLDQVTIFNRVITPAEVSTQRINHAPKSWNLSSDGVNDRPFSTPSVFSRAYDAERDTLTVKSWTTPAHGSVTHNGDGSFTFTPVAGYVGNDSFQVTIEDGMGGYHRATMSLKIVTEPVGGTHLPVTRFTNFAALQAGGVDISHSGMRVPRAVDWDGDGKKDILVGAGGYVWRYLNTGTAAAPSFAAGVRVQAAGADIYANTTGNSPITLADMTGDGVPDLVMADSASKLRVYRNTAAAGATPVYAASAFVKKADGTTDFILPDKRFDIGDYNADGKPDLITGTYSGNVQVYLNVNTAASPRFETSTVLFGGSYNIYPRFCDLGLNGQTDLVRGVNWGDVKYWLNVPSNGLSGDQYLTITDSTGAAPAIKNLTDGVIADFADFNGDGKTDMLIGGHSSDKIFIAYGVSESAAESIARIEAIYDANLAALGTALSANSNALLGQVNAANLNLVGHLQKGSLGTRQAVFNALAAHINKYAFLKYQELDTAVYHHVPSIVLQNWVILHHLLPDNAAHRTNVADIMGLTGTARVIYLENGLALGDNGKSVPAAYNTIRDFQRRHPREAFPDAVITFEQLYGDNRGGFVWTPNSTKNTFGQWALGNSNEWAGDLTTAIESTLGAGSASGDYFTFVMSHEVCHSLDNYVNTRANADLRRRWGQRMVYAAGPDVIAGPDGWFSVSATQANFQAKGYYTPATQTWDQAWNAYWATGPGAAFNTLASMRGDIKTFLGMPQESLATQANHHWTNGPGRLIGALDRFRRGEAQGIEPMKANMTEVVDFVDYISSGMNRVNLVETKNPTGSNVVWTDHLADLERDDKGRITRITVDNRIYQLTLSDSGIVTQVLTEADLAPRTVKFALASTSRNETDGTAVITVTLDLPTRVAPVSVDFSDAGTGTATPGSDYTLTPGTLTFAVGEQVKTITVSLLNNASVEAPEAVILALSNPVGADLGSPATHTLQIVDATAPVVATRLFAAASNMAANTVIGTVSATPASGRTIADWTILAGNTGNAFAINAAGQVSLTTPGALPNPGGVQLVVRATDNAGSMGDGLVNIICNAPANGVVEQRWNGSFVFWGENWSGTPAYTGALPTFTAARDVGQDYSRRLTGYLKPAVSGDYTFWIAGDDDCRLYLGSNGSSSSKTQIARVDGWSNFQEWDKQTGQRSAVIPLVAGNVYWLEANHLEASGGDHVSVAWQGPGISRQAIPSSVIFPNVAGVNFENPPVPPTIAVTSPANGTTFTSRNPISVSANVAGGSVPVTSVDFYDGAALIASDTSAPYSATLGYPTSGTHTLTARAINPGGAVTSAAVTITIQLNTDPSADPDGDGFTTGLELALGTDPNYAASKPSALYDNLRAWWKLDETSGTIADDTTGRAQDGALLNGATWATGITGGGISLNGTNQSVQVPALNLSSNTVTITGWVKRNGPQSTWAGLVFHRGGSVSGLGFGANNELRYHWNAASNTYNFASGLTVPDNTWTFCALVVEAAKATLYMQPAGGTMQLAVNPVAHGASAFDSSLHLGQDALGGRLFNGSLDDVCIYTRSLSSAEISQVYESANPPHAPVFTSNPLTKPGATQDAAYTGNTLAGDATDADEGDTLAFSKVSGPAWLSVAENGELSGTPSLTDAGVNSFAVRVTDAGGLTADATLRISVSQGGSDGTWSNGAGGSWTTAANWSGNTIATSGGRSADFSTLNLTADTTVTLDGGRTIGSLVFGDTIPSNNWTLNTGSGGVLTLAVSSGTPTINVVNQNATIGVVMAGTQGFQKTGTGGLTLTAANTYTGATTVLGGVAYGSGTGQSLTLANPTGAAIAGDVQLGNGTALGAPSILKMGAANQFASSSIVTFSASGFPSQAVLKLMGFNQTVAGLSSGSDAQNTIENTESESGPGNGTLTINSTGNYTYAGTLRDHWTNGTGILNIAKTGSGTQTLSGSAIQYSGSTTINGGRLTLTSGAQQSLKSTSVSVASGGILELNLTANQDLGPVNTTFSGAGIIQKTGAGTLRIGYTGAVRNHAITQTTGGVLDMQAGDLNIGWTNVALNSNQGGIYLASGAKLHNSQSAGMQFDWLSGSGDINNAFNSTTPVLTIGVAGTTDNAAYGVSNNTATFSGRIGYAETYNGVSVGTLGLVKTGAGTQILSGICGYTGSTTVNGGKLLINGSLANTTTTVASGGTLGGTGTIGGAVSVAGTLAPGSNGIGTLTINNTLSLSGTAQMEISKSGGTLTADKVSGVSTLIYGGTLTVTHSGDALVAGNTFQLFSATSYSGSFTTLNLPTLGSGLAWDTSRLTADGTIAVYSTSGSGLPAGWAKADIGSPSIAGTSSESGGVFTLAGSGTGFANGSDQAHFIWQTLSGDGEVKVRLSSMSGGDATNATAGVMIRESTLAGSRFAFCGRKGDGSMQLIRRLSSGGNITTTTNGTNSAPVWVRLVRAGNTITAYKSTDGSSWTTVSTDTVTMASQISIGVLTSSGNNTSSTTATFDNVIIVP